MAETRVCPRCGAPVPVDAPLDQCPQCLLNLGLARGSEGFRGWFGHYELRRQIGRGGMGVVYEAVDADLHRPVALKMILDAQLASPVARRRFTIEAEAAAKLDHPNIVPIYEIGECEGHPFLSMRLVHGESLRERMTRGEFSDTGNDGRLSKVNRPRAIVQFMAKIARAVHHAHEHGVLHRDLKPANILVDTEGEPHLTDFGLAKILDAQGNSEEVSVTGAVLGTPSYMAPEQAAGQRVTAAADIYGLGAILYELLTGQPPFKATTALETMRQLTEHEPVRPRHVCKSIPEDLDTICMKCLEKHPDCRYHSAAALAEDLERWLEQRPIHARPAGALVRVTRWTRRNPLGTALIASLCVCLAGALVLLHVARKAWQESEAVRSALVWQFTQQIEARWRDRRQSGALFSALDLACLCDYPAPSVRNKTLRLTWDTSVDENPISLAMAYAPVLRLLGEKMEKRLQRPVVFDLSAHKSGRGPAGAVGAGMVDVQRMGALAYVRAKSATPGLQPVVHERAGKEAVIFARKGLGITNLAGVAGRRIAFAGSNSCVSLWAKVHLARAGVTAANLAAYEHLDSGGRSESKSAPLQPGSAVEMEERAEASAQKVVIQRVLARDFDVGESPRHHFEHSRYRGLVELYSYAVNPSVYVARTGLEPAVVEALRQALSSFQTEPEKELLRKLHETVVEGFEAASDADFDELRLALDNEVARFEKR